MYSHSVRRFRGAERRLRVDLLSRLQDQIHHTIPSDHTLFGATDSFCGKHNWKIIFLIRRLHFLFFFAPGETPIRRWVETASNSFSSTRLTPAGDNVWTCVRLINFWKGKWQSKISWRRRWSKLPFAEAARLPSRNSWIRSEADAFHSIFRFSKSCIDLYRRQRCSALLFSIFKDLVLSLNVKICQQKQKQ